MSKAYQVVRDFEQALCEYTGAPYCVTVNSCTSALFLCSLYVKVKDFDEVLVPRITYPSVPASIIHAGGRIVFEDCEWQKDGWYVLTDIIKREKGIIDSAKYLSRDMFKYFTVAKSFKQEIFVCLSFHGKKCLKIGHGGAILTANKEAYEWFKLARFDGRHECALPDDKLAFAGWNCYMSPEEAARGLELLQWLPDHNIDAPNPYQDLSQYDFYTKANR